MLAINVLIPNGTVARLEQFRSPQLYTNPQRATSRRRGWLKTNHSLYESLMSLSPVRVHLQLMWSQNWLPWQRSMHPRSRLCLHYIVWPRKPTPRIKQPVASCHTAEVISIQSLPAPPHTPRGQSISEVGGEIPTMFGIHMPYAICKAVAVVVCPVTDGTEPKMRLGRARSHFRPNRPGFSKPSLAEF